MKKSFIALAVAGAVAAPITANAADVSYGGVVIMDLYLNNTSETTGTDGVTTINTEEGPSIKSNDIQFNVSATEDVGFGTAFAGFRFDLDGVSGKEGLDDIDSVKVGLEGNFGTVTLGEGSDYAESGQLAGDIALDSGSGTGTLGTPNAALSYEIPAVVPGLTVGVNLLATTYKGNNEKTGMGFGLSYSADLGDSGTISAGFGSANATEIAKSNGADGSLVDGKETSGSYSSVGLSYAIMGFSIAVAQQSVTGQEIVNSPANPDTGLTEDGEPGDLTSTDIKVGYATGPVSAAITNSSVVQAADVGDDSTKMVTRIDLGYQLSDNVSVSLRNENTTTEYWAGSKEGQAGYTRVGMALEF